MRCAKGSSALLPWLADTLDGGLVVVHVLVLGLGPLDLFLPSLSARWSLVALSRRQNPLLTDQRSGYATDSCVTEGPPRPGSKADQKRAKIPVRVFGQEPPIPLKLPSNFPQPA
jgi:hypothetical protein